MKQVICLIAVCIFVQTINSTIITEPPDDNGPRDKCRSDIYNVGYMKLGETKHIPGECTIAHCKQDASIQFEVCPVQVGNPNSDCFQPIDKTKTYPDCCPKKVC